MLYYSWVSILPYFATFSIFKIFHYNCHFFEESLKKVLCGSGECVLVDLRQHFNQKEAIMSNLPFPEFGFVRLKQIIGDPKAEPPVPAVIPVSRSTWWQGVKDGRFPKSIKLTPRTTVWRAEDIRAFVEQLSARPTEKP